VSPTSLFKHDAGIQQIKKIGTCLCFTMYILSAIACWHHCWHVPAKASITSETCPVAVLYLAHWASKVPETLEAHETSRDSSQASWGHDPRSWLPNGSHLLMAEHSKHSKTNDFHAEVIEGK